MDHSIQVIAPREGSVGEIVLLEVAPAAFNVVEFGGLFCCAALRVGSHSTVSHGRSARALVVALLVWIGPLSRTKTSGRVRSVVP